MISARIDLQARVNHRGCGPNRACTGRVSTISLNKEKHASMADLTKSPLCTDILGSLGSASWVRRMYELARELIAQHGADHVYDYSIGNPSLEPPREVLMRSNAKVHVLSRACTNT